MIRILAVLGVLVLIASIVGCGDNPEEPVVVPAPTNLTIAVAGTDSLSVLLSWTAPVVAVDIDGYIVSFKGNVLDTVTTTSYQHTPSSLGAYSVKAYKGSDASSAIEKSTALHEETGEGPLYYLADPDTTHPSGYGWDAAGSGQTYSAASANKDFIDLVLDADEDLRSPADTFGSSWHTTGIAYDGAWTYAGMVTAPVSGYFTWQNVVVNGVYVLYPESGNYVKMEITSYDAGTHSIAFKFGYQTVTGFRKLG
jgi:hypothetical protein